MHAKAFVHLVFEALLYLKPQKPLISLATLVELGAQGYNLGKAEIHGVVTHASTDRRGEQWLQRTGRGADTMLELVKLPVTIFMNFASSYWCDELPVSKEAWELVEVEIRRAYKNEGAGPSFGFLLSEASRLGIDPLDIHRVVAFKQLMPNGNFKLNENGRLEEKEMDLSIKRGAPISEPPEVGGHGYRNQTAPQVRDMYEKLCLVLGSPELSSEPRDELFLVLDTNVFMHYKRPDLVSWSELFDDEIKEFVLYIPHVLLTEIGELKDKQDGKPKRERAKTLDRWFGELVSESTPQLSNGLRVEFQDIENHDYYRRLRGHDPQHEDARFISSCTALMGQGKRVCFIGNDTGAMLQAKAVQVPFKQAPEAWKLPVVLSEEDKELKRLRREIQELKHRRPKLNVRFENGESYQQARTFLRQKDGPVDIDVEMSKVQEEAAQMLDAFRALNAPKTTKINHDSLLSLEAQRHLYGMSMHKLTDFEEQVRRYINESRTYLEELSCMYQLRSHTYGVLFVLHNEGSTPAHHIRLTLSIPKSEDYEVLPDFPRYPSPKRPQPPSMYTNPLPSPHDTMASLRANTYIRQALGIEPEKLPEPFFTSTWRELESCWEWEYRGSTLQQHDQVDSPLFYIRTHNHSSTRGIKLNVVCYCDDLPKPSSFKLNLSLKEDGQ